MHSQKGRIPRKLLHTAVIICVAVLCLTSVGITSAKYISQSLRVGSLVALSDFRKQYRYFGHQKAGGQHRENI